MFELCASILAADFANLERDMRAANAAGVDAFHIDVMDGHFVPAISFGTGMVRTMERLTTKPLDVHLMVEKPLDFLPELEELGVKRVSVHYEIPGGPEAALRAICAAVGVPVVAIGGISKQNLLSLAHCGEAGVALVSAIFAAEDIEEEFRELRRLAEML